MKNLKDIRRAVADYVASEGCSCCRNIDKHREAHMRLAKLLRVKPHPKQKDWHDFSKFETKTSEKKKG